MGALGLLRLSFQQGRDGQVTLQKTAFRRLEMDDLREAKRGSYEGTFKWSSGVKAVMVFLLRSAAESLRQADVASPEDNSPYVLEGARPSIAASVNDVLTKRPVWVYDVFGTASGDLPLLGEMVQRRNSDFSTDAAGNVELWLDADVFPGSKIEVYLNGKQLTDERDLDRLAEDISQQWGSRGDMRKTAQPSKEKLGCDAANTMVDSWQRLADSGGADDVTMQHFQMIFEMLTDDCEYACAGVQELQLHGHWRGKQNVIRAASENQMKNHNVGQFLSLNSLTCDNDTLAIFAQDRLFSKAVQRWFDLHVVTQMTFRDGELVKVFQMLAED